MPRHMRSLAGTIAMLLAALLVLALMGTGQAESLPNMDRLGRLLRHGAAFFGIPTTFLLGDADEPSLAVGDFNHDGLPDLAVAEADTDAVWLLPGDGTGGFGP